ncbi:MAG: ribosome biogenesis GTPase Der [Candidatus Azotimanducaceae bacterium]|uniref:GTPase Der n=1 Tax=OM182 bacterium TaxID=2510334 RepID=A0A520S0Y5_9GAMM|nr:ribosome biogenesis GTPase Der [Gammaproteobacteria bacterium]OUV67446.1 MAG: ribosome biogenesis GTPase Der [Gammaproteobacteria bacterium TMED133]RZO76132.1 MAG: ribosome biogenesis GTPase Der [OM182 bacterium]
MLPVIALVGRPNVGKSTLFNRLTRSRDAIVGSFSGLTRDRQYGRGATGDIDYVVVDTGGLTDEKGGIDKFMANQVMQAIDEADLIIFMLDAKDGRLVGDETIAEMLRLQSVPVLPVVNKIDGQDPAIAGSEFFALGLGEPMYISASNGQGITQLINYKIASYPIFSVEISTNPDETTAHGIKIAVVGRPNVGKSTLVNRLLGEDRVVVFDSGGTTRDSIYIPFEREGQNYTFIDTAGIRRRGKVAERIEKFSVVKTLDAILDAHVVILMLDARDGVVEQDLHLLGHVLDAGRALVIVINKWDGLDSELRENIRFELERRLTFIGFARIHFVSALYGSGVGNLYDSVHRAYDSATRGIKTSELNSVLQKAIMDHSPPLVRGRRIKLRYAHLGGINPPRIVVHGNQTDAVPASYRRYLEHRFIAELKLEGTPVHFEFKTGENPFKEQKNQLNRRQISRKRRLMDFVKKNERRRKRRR